MSAKMTYVTIYTNVMETVDQLDDDSAGRLFKAILHHASGEDVALNGQERLVYKLMITSIDRHMQKYEQTCEKRREAANARWKNSTAQMQMHANAQNCMQTDTSVLKEEREKKKEKKEKKKDINIISSTASVEQQPFIFSLPLIDGTSYGVTQSEVNQYAQLYPAVDIMQEYRNMAGWLNANPTKRKTSRGITRFINSWLAREQDKPKPMQRPAAKNGYYNPFLDRIEKEG